MTLVRYNPNRVLKDFGHDFDHVFDSFFRMPSTMKSCNCDFMPSVDITDDKDHVRIDVELPGMKKEDIKVTVEDSVLTVSGERKTKSEEKDKNYIRTERSYGTFARSFTLSDDINTENIKADYKDGILSVSLAKQEKAKPKEINVEVA